MTSRDLFQASRQRWIIPINQLFFTSSRFPRASDREIKGYRPKESTFPCHDGGSASARALIRLPAQVQERKEGRAGKNSTRHSFTYRGLFRCENCNTAMAPERQKGHVYWVAGAFWEATVARALMGVSFLGIVNNGMNILNVPIDIQLIANGAIIVVALAIATRKA
jgi:hypothetical protein